MPDDVLLKHQSLINTLKAELGKPTFDAFFNRKTLALSGSEKFLVKMEMNRLSQPIDRFIDLRGQVTGEVRAYNYNGKQHYMDAIAIDVFERELKRHKAYTLAVYEAVMNTENNHKVMQQKAREKGELAPTNSKEPKKDSNRVHQVTFASYESRSEERMNYSIKVRLILNQGNEVEASTSDISVSGCKVKLPKRYVAKTGQIIRMRLIGLEQDFEMGLKEGLEYEVVAVDHVNNELNHVRMKRTFTDDNQVIDDFLKSFIHGNKRRYKVNLDNTLEAVIVKGYEQYYLPRITSLFVYLNAKEQRYSPSLILTNENNINSIRYFNDENRQCVLNTILHPKRIEQLLTQSSDVKTTTLYCFNHINKNRIYYYSATAEELNNTPRMRDLFLGFASKKATFRVFNVQLMPCSSEDSFIPLSLPESAGAEVARLNKPPSPRVQGIIQNTQYQVLLSDITSPENIAAYQSRSFDSSQVNALKHFGHAKLKQYPQQEFVALDYVNLRNETRYLYQTEIHLEQEEKGTISGHTLDFSVHGLQLELDTPTEYEKGDLLLVAFPDLQKLTKKYQLNKLPYEIMAISKTRTVINLKTYQPTQTMEHQGAAFLSQLIESNKNKLKASEDSPKTPGLSTALRNMATKNICQFPFYLHKKGAAINVGAIARGLYPSTMHLLLSHMENQLGSYSLEQLINKNTFEALFAQPIKDAKRQDPPMQAELYVRLNPNKANSSAVICDTFKQGQSQSNRPSFITASVKEELFFAFRLYLSRTGRPDTDYISKELGYISQYAMHKAKDLEEELWSVIGVGDIIDISDEVIQRHQIDAELITNMNKRKRLWQQKTQFLLR